MNERVSAENGGIPAEAIDRKLGSETILQAVGVPFFAALPVIETTAEALKRSKEEVALRTLCLHLVAAKGEGLEQEVVEGVLESYELRPHLSPKELAFACVVGSRARGCLVDCDNLLHGYTLRRAARPRS